MSRSAKNFLYNQRHGQEHRKKSKNKLLAVNYYREVPHLSYGGVNGSVSDN